jgi:hypothetical protein
VTETASCFTSPILVGSPRVRSVRAGALLGLSLVLSYGPSPALASGPQLAGSSGDWKAYTLNDDGNQNCFVSSTPKRRQPDSLKRDPGNLFITYHPAKKAPPEVAISLGFPVKTGASHTLQISGQSFSLYGKGENAWPRNDADGTKIVDLMKSGQQVLVASVSGRGNRNIDTFSLSGFSNAWETATRSCK